MVYNLGFTLLPGLAIHLREPASNRCRRTKSSASAGQRWSLPIPTSGKRVGLRQEGHPFHLYRYWAFYHFALSSDQWHRGGELISSKSQIDNRGIEYKVFAFKSCATVDLERLQVMDRWTSPSEHHFRDVCLRRHLLEMKWKFILLIY